MKLYYKDWDLNMELLNQSVHDATTLLENQV
jgi:hypothetical protein